MAGRILPPLDEANPLVKRIFAATNKLVLVGWVALAAYPHLDPKLAQRVVLSTMFGTGVVNAFCLFSHKTPEGAGIGSVRQMCNLFRRATSRQLQGLWLHFLCFDLMTGLWMVQDAKENHVPHYYVVLPCLVVLCIFGPSGFVAYMTARATIAGLL